MYSERQYNHKFVRTVLILSIVIMALILFFVIQPTQAQYEVAQPTLVGDLGGLETLVGGFQMPQVHTLSPRNGSLSYVCPTEETCDRTGSWEWFDVEQDSMFFVVLTYNQAQIWAIDGYQLGTDYTITSTTDGYTVISFTEIQTEGSELLIQVRSITATTEYGVR